MVPWREFVAKIGRAEGTVTLSGDEQQQDCAAISCRPGGSKKRLRVLGERPQQELEP